MKKRSSVIALAAVATFAFGSLSYAGSDHKHDGHKHDAAPTWHYEGPHGPEHWGNLDERYILCKKGKMESPIDIEAPIQTGAPSVEFQYHPSASIKVLNNGHTIKESYESADSRLIVDGKPYRLMQFHFHTPSEHTIEGKHSPMEVHLVHQNAEDKDLAVVGVMIEEGKENEAIGAIWEKVPEKVGEEITSKANFNALSLLPKEKGFFHYSGSLTTPPCSEGVRWFVMKDPIQFSKEHIEKFEEIIGHSNRPVQARNGRSIYVSEK
uniref:carbonic anhydrase n=1 Tax=Candidatus Kentrum sp. LPFa TaxID=2126335 RepID=A0A450X836_9GAMM|nr:MAG: carbonic anhydrase [Candidatus Kentron sp. LPFa]VFK25477.1 MAG: carbonic anhydrase [Candidatus Kentron sp. LPFa]